MTPLVLAVALLTGQVTTTNCKPGSDCVARSFRSTQLAAGSGGRMGAFCQGSSTGPSWAWGLENAATTYSLYVDTGVMNACPRSGGFTATLMSFSTVSSVTILNYLLSLAVGAAQFSTASAAATPTARNTTAGRLQTEQVFNNLYYRDATVSTMGHSWIVGGGQHPTQQVFTASGRVGAESTVCPLVVSQVPQVGGSAGSPISHTCTATAAATSQLGTVTGRSYRHSATLASAGSIDTVVTQAFLQPRQAPRFCAWVQTPSTISSIRLWVGLFTAAPGSSDGPTASYIGFRYSTAAGDSTWQICSADGATSSCTSTGLGSVSTSREYLLCADHTSSGAIYGQVSGEGSTPVFVTKSTNLPAVNANLGFVHSVEALAASARGFGLSSWSAEQR